MKIAVLGGAGLTGQCAAKNLAENKRVSEILIADLNKERISKVEKKLRSDKLTTATVDVSDVSETTRLLKGFDVVINAVQYYFNLDVMRAALNAKVNYVDLGGLYHMTLKQLELDQLFRSEGLTAIIGMGAQPGITNTVAKHASASLDHMIAVKIRDGSRDLTENAPPFVITWSLQTLLDEIVLDAVVYEDGRLITIPPLSRSEVVEFPEPVGTLETYVTLHSEIATFPRTFRDKGLSYCDWMEGSPNFMFVKMLADIGLADTNEVEVAGVRVKPRSFLLKLIESRGLLGYPEDVVPNDWEITRMIIEGTRNGRKLKLVYDIIIPPKPEWKMSCAQVGVGIPASIVAMMIADGEIKTKGVAPPETCVPTDRFFEELGRHGIKIVENVSGPLN